MVATLKTRKELFPRVFVPVTIATSLEMVNQTHASSHKKMRQAYGIKGFVM